MDGVRLSLLASALTLAACGGGSDTGSLSVAVTDAPVDGAKHVYVTFSGIQLQGPDGTTTIALDKPTTPIDLLNLNEGRAEALLNKLTVSAGHYEWLRLMVDTEGSRDTYLVMNDDSEHELTIPSGAQTGLKLIRGFDVPAGGAADFIIDFDLRKSLVDSAKGYLLKPVLRVEDKALVGAVVGSVDLSYYGCDNAGDAIYVFKGSDAPTDINTTDPTSGPITTAEVKYHEDGTYGYRAAFLSPGDYTVALTCDAENDRADAQDTLNFKQAYNVTVVADKDTIQHFPAP